MASSSASIIASMQDSTNDCSYSMDELMPPLRSDLELCVCRNQLHRSRQVQEKDLEIKLLNEELKIIYSRTVRLENTCADQKIQLQEMDSLKRQVEYLSSGWKTNCRSIKDFHDELEWNTPSSTNENIPSGTNDTSAKSENIPSGTNDTSVKSENIQSGTNDTSVKSENIQSGTNDTSAKSKKTLSAANDRTALTPCDEIEFDLSDINRNAKGPDYEVDAQTGKLWTELSSEEQTSCKDDDSEEINPMSPLYEILEIIDNLFDDCCAWERKKRMGE